MSLLIPFGEFILVSLGTFICRHFEYPVVHVYVLCLNSSSGIGQYVSGSGKLVFNSYQSMMCRVFIMDLYIHPIEI